MAKKDLQQLQTIKERMLAAGIPEDEVNTLVDPLKNELQRRVCGLVWEHTTTSIPDMEGKIPALTPVTGKNIVNDIKGDNHVLIEGENLLALMAMQYTHIDENGKGMIDVIYIDPPYNTGSVSFAYNDKFEKSEWLSMMDIRLKLARNLLKDDGVIFVQLDEGYQAELKLLMNEVFGQDKHAVTLHVEMSATQGMKVKAAQSGTVVKNAEYVTVYTKDGHKDIAKTLIYDYRPEYDKHYNKILLAGDIPADLKTTFNIAHPEAKITQLEDYAWNKTFQQFVSDNQDIIFTYHSTVGFNINDYEIGKVTRVFQSGRNYIVERKDNNVYQLIPLSVSFGQCDDFYSSYGLRKIRGDLWKDFYKDMGNVNKEGTVSFDNGKKPVRLIKQLIKMVTRSTEPCTVLDFFAGSGTTGHAVLDLNKEDGGHRQFILCTNNELGKDALKTAKKNGYVAGSEEYEALGVCHAVTYPRMQNIFPDYPGNNLYYYRIDQNIAESAIDDVTIANMASRAVFYVAMKENVYNAEHHDGYYLLYNDKTDIAVVTDPDMDMFDVEDEIVPTAFTREHRKVYCSVYESCMRNGIEYIPYPKEVLDVLKAAKKYIRREAA